jgi:VWFA-related protein
MTSRRQINRCVRAGPAAIIRPVTTERGLAARRAMDDNSHPREEGTMMIFAALLLILAQQTPSAPPFKSDVNVVEVDVVVTDKAGRPVRGLRREDFDVLEDGKAVELATFVVVDVPAAPPGAEIPAADRSAASIASNDQPDDGRVILIVLDDYHVSFDLRRIVAVKAVARKLVERLGPSDQAAIIATSGRSAMQAEFTADKARLAQAIDQFFPQSESGGSGPPGQGLGPAAGGGSFGFIHEMKARWAMETLSSAAKALAMIPHRRKAVLLVSQGLPATLDEIISNPNASGGWQAMRDFIVTAQRSNVAIYPVDPCGLDVDAGCSMASRDHLRSLAEGTGGFAVTNTNAPETGVERMVAENGTYYLLGYYSTAAPNDGKRHRIKVRTRTPGLEVRAREGYVSSRRANAPRASSPTLDELIAAPIQTRGLTMRVAAVPAPLAAAPRSTVAVAIELQAAEAVRAGRIDFSVVAIDSDGKIRGRQRLTSTFQPGAAPPAGWTRLGTRVDVPPGRYQIRVAGAVPNGARGSVFTEVTVPKFSDNLSLGGLSLAATSALAATRADALVNVLPLIPLATRDVSPTTQLSAQLPIRIAPKAASGPVSITATLVHLDGTRVQLDAASSPAGEYASDSARVYQVSVPQNLPAGSYRLAVEVSLGGTRATREASFRVTP